MVLVLLLDDTRPVPLCLVWRTGPKTLGGKFGLVWCGVVWCGVVWWLYPPPRPFLYSDHLHATVSSHPRGNILQVTVSSPPPPPITLQRTRDTKQDMQAQGHMNHKMSPKLLFGMHVQL